MTEERWGRGNLTEAEQELLTLFEESVKRS